MARKKGPFIAGKQYGDPEEPDADDMAGGPSADVPKTFSGPPPKPFGSMKKDKGPRAKAGPKSYY
jgi:hypothetical protein